MIVGLKKRTFLLLMCEGTASAFFALTGLLIVRGLSVEAYGRFAGALALSQIVVVIIDAGMGQRIARDMASPHESDHQNALDIFRARLLSTLVLSLFLLALGFVGQGRYAGAITCALVSALLLLSLVDLFCWVLKGGGDILEAGLLQILSRLMLLIAVYAVLKINPSLERIVEAHLLTSFCAASLGGYWIISRRRLFTWGLPRWSRLEKLFASIYQLGFILILSVAFSRLDVILLEYLRGAVDAGKFAAATRILDAVRLFPMVVYGIHLPAFSALRTNQAEFRRTLGEAILVLTSAGIFIAVVGTFFSHPICALALGSHGVGAERFLVPLLWGCPFMFLNIGMLAVYLAKENFGILFKAIAAAVFCDVLLNLILIPLWGPMATAWIRTSCEIGMSTVFLWGLPQAVSLKIQPAY